MSRPGAALLESLVAEERRGAPGRARDAALAAAEQGGPGAAEHLLDAAYALLVAGEPRAAQRVLERAAAAAAGPAVERRIHACRSWAEQLDRNWYPGDTGAEIADETGVPMLLGERPAPEDLETLIVEACVAKGPLPLLSVRAVIESMVRSGTPALGSVLGSGVQDLQAFATAMDGAGVGVSAVWALCAQADLAWRSGLAAEATRFLANARPLYEQLGDRVGLAGTHLLEGDWYATPGSSPEALGFALAPQNLPSPLEPARDLARAASCYAQAAALLDGAAAPRALGATALRRAAVCWAEGRFEDQRTRLGEADAAFADAGDASQRRVVAVHRLLAENADGELAALRLAAGTGWDQQARGPIAEILAWATEEGSASFGAGLGRLLERAAEAWRRSGDNDRAAVAYSMALPLVRLGGGVLPAGVLDALAGVDDARNFTARALVRLEQAVRALPPAAAVGDDPREWMQRVNLVTSMVGAQSRRTGSSTAGLGVTGLERAVERLRELAAVAGVPDADVTASLLRDAGAMLEELGRARRQDSLDEILSETADAGTRMVAMTAQAVRDQIAQMTALAALQRGRLAQRAGWLPEADGWFSSSLEMIDAGPPATRWIGVLACAAWLREDEALARFREVRASRLIPDDLLAVLALRARDYDAAKALFPAADAAGLEWIDVADRVELALETGEQADALALADVAIDRFETIVGALGRDPDRLATCDDIKATSLYLSASRAALAMAGECERRGDAAGRDAALARSFEISDRGRSLALATLVRGTAEATTGDDAPRRRWQQAATEWSAAFERLLAAYDGEDDAATIEAAEASATTLTRADETLVALEAEIESSRPTAVASARRLPPPVRLDAVQRALPPDGCLLQYHVVGRELVAWGVTRDRIEAARRRLDTPGVEALVGAFWRACSVGVAGEEADELGSLLLDPVAGMVGASRRLVIVPFGPLATVPFHALLFAGAPLGHERAISFLPAASHLAGGRLDEPIDEGSAVLAVGDPAFDPAAQPSLRRLPGAAVEARTVGELWGSEDDVLVDTDASESELLKRLAGRAIVHLAAHGHLDEIAPSTSALVLAGADRLTVSDLIGLRLDAELAVLSACDSGRGAVTLGGDVIGLTRGLLASGVRRALVSLWPVDDIAACATMVAFHERLRETGVPAQALADAQATVRALSGAELAARYTAVSGEAAPPTHTLRRGGGTPVAATVRRGIPLDPSFVDADEPEAQPVAALDGSMERVWAPFVLVGG